MSTWRNGVHHEYSGSMCAELLSKYVSDILVWENILITPFLAKIFYAVTADYV